jgi:DNA-directed RNA polymerase omega subunit
MLKPSMQELMKKVGNRYLLVNLTAQRARDIAEESERTGEPLDDKAVKLALDEIADGSIVYRPGPRTEPVIISQSNAIAAAMIDIDSIDLDAFDDERDDEDGEDEDDYDDGLGNKRSLKEFDDEELDDGDVPDEDR